MYGVNADPNPKLVDLGMYPGHGRCRLPALWLIGLHPTKANVVILQKTTKRHHADQRVPGFMQLGLESLSPAPPRHHSPMLSSPILS